MRAWIFYEPGDLRLEDIPVPTPGPGEVLVDVKAAATCGTDLKSYRRGHPTIFTKLPDRFGHEFAGIVSAVGEGVDKFKIGDRVVAANSAPCGACWACQIGRESLCENLMYLNGGFAEKIIIPQRIVDRNTYIIPESLPFEAAAPVEPLACVVHGVAESGIEMGDTVVVHGAGPIGQMFNALVQLRGANVISADFSEERLELSRQAGCVGTVNLSAYEDTPSRAAAIKAATPYGRGADVSIEATGFADAWEQAIQSVRPGGMVVEFGGPKKGSVVTFDPVAMHYQEFTVKGVYHHQPRYVKTAVELLKSGKFDGMSLCTEIRPLEALVDSLEDMAQGKGAKYILKP